jgi:transposase
MPTHFYTIGQRIQALTLLAQKCTYKQVEELIGYKKRALIDLKKKIIKKFGYNPLINRRIEVEMVQDLPRLGRPRTARNTETTAAILGTVRSSTSGREMSSDQLGYLHGISGASTWRILNENGLNKVKPTRKPGLTKAMKRARYQFALDHKDWTIDDWKNIIWSDETSFVLGVRRGGLKVWRTTAEAYDKTVVRNRWKGFSSFMFWGCFSYNHKGPMHIWTTETAKEKKVAQEELDDWNSEIFWKAAEEFDERLLQRDAARTRGKKPLFRFGEKQGKLVRKAKSGGIDWYRYQKEILKPKLFPFATEIDGIVMEDRAAPHAHHFQGKLFEAEGIERLPWPSNSPDLNPIECAWYYIKRQISKRGNIPQTRAEAEKAWEKAWNDLSQTRIQHWIERIPRHIQKVIEQEGGNMYKEGRKD